MGNRRPARLYLPQRHWFIGLLMLVMTVLVLGATIASCGVPTKPTQEDAMQDVIQLLEGQGFTPNIGLSGTYGPGNVIQTTESGAEGARPLPSPVVFLWASDCFPGQAPRTSAFVLPDSYERRAGSVSMGVKILALLLPSLNVDRSAVSDYTMTLGDTEVQTFAKGDLSHQFSEKCVQALVQAMEDGDQIDWFSVIVEAVVADSLTLRILWRENTSVGARASQKSSIKDQLGRILRGAASSALPVSASVGVESESDKITVLQSNVPVIVGYRIRPLQPVYDK